MNVHFNHPFGPEVWHNRILMMTLVVWALAQTTKVIIGVFKEKKFNFRWFIGTGFPAQWDPKLGIHVT